MQLLRAASPEDHAVASHRLRILSDPEYMKTHPAPERTIRRWRKLYRLAEESHRNGLLGLFPKFRESLPKWIDMREPAALEEWKQTLAKLNYTTA